MVAIRHDIKERIFVLKGKIGEFRRIQNHVILSDGIRLSNPV